MTPNSIPTANQHPAVESEASIPGEQVTVLNMELDIPPTMDVLPHGTPIHTVDKDTMAEAQFLAQQRKFWPSGLL